MNEFFKFPSTAHLMPPDDVDVRTDKVMSESERDAFLQHELVVEEKIDGANLGISFDSSGNIRVQNRGSYLPIPAAGQWKKLAEWLTPRTDAFFDQLTDRYILFGEWCYAQHTVVYESLPDWFLGFDLYDKVTARFLSCLRRDEMCKAMSVAQVPNLGRGHFTISELGGLLQKSHFANKPAEGLYLRADQDGWEKQRAKLVRATFVQSIEQHWSRSGIKANRLK